MQAERLRGALDALPTTPGVYIMKGRGGEPLYIGKAASLKARVRSYFQQASGPRSSTIAALIPRVESIETISANSAVDALILENNLIKQLLPRYNIKLKDDKRYPYVRVSTKEPFPALSVTREAKQDGNRYFGPFAQSRAVRGSLKRLTTLFPVRTCSLDLKESGNRHRVCLDYHIGKCPGPCADHISPEEYAKIVRGALMFLSGKTASFIEELRVEMAEASKALDFEKAARLRDRIREIEQLSERRQVESSSGESYDAIGCAVLETMACAQVLMVRGGKLIEREQFFLTDVEGETPERVLSAFVPQYYAEASYVPPAVALQTEIEMSDLTQTWLEQKRGAKARLYAPTRGRRRDMTLLAAKNAETALAQRAAHVVGSSDEHPGLKQLMETLNLDRLPRRIEGFDISNAGGEIVVGSMVVFEDGKPARSEYRRYRIRDAQGQDDYAAMKQLIYRRFSRAIQEGSAMPNLILIDGGMGQLKAAEEALAEVDYPQQPRLGLAKRFEHIYLPGGSEPMRLRKDQPALHLIQHLRDEAHRFAVFYLRRLRSRQLTHSILDDIPQVGKRRKQALLERFGDVSAIQEASLDDLLAVPSMTRPVAQLIYKRFRKRSKV